MGFSHPCLDAFKGTLILGQSDSLSHKLGVFSFLVQPFEYKGGYALSHYDNANKMFLKPNDQHHQCQSL